MKLGKAFSDNLAIGQSVRLTISDDSRSWWHGSGRALLFCSIVCVAFFALVIRLVYLTMVRGHELRTFADGNRTRELIRHASRGILYDRTGKPLTINMGQYRLLHPCEIKNNTGCTERISQKEGQQLEQEGLPAGSFIEIDYARQYPYGSALAHLLGFTGELSPNELNNEYFHIRRYGPGDRIGRSGVEAVFEEKLRGRNGKELVEVDAQGKIVRTLGRDAEVVGESVTLSVDAELARVVAEAFQGLAKPGLAPRGAIVVAKPSTGEILALYSSPSFDPNTFTSALTQAAYDLLSTDPDKPLFFRTIGGVYPPGSTFKIVTAVGALQEGVTNKDTTIEDNGTITIGPFSFANWYFTQFGKTEGMVDIVKAIQRSNDIFFYRTGERLGITKLADWAHRVGIGKPLGIELGGEAGGLVPDPAWKNEYFTSAADLKERNNQWYLGDTYHIAIGQGYLLVTPLQVNAWTNVIANGGWLCSPTIRKVLSPKSNVQNCKNLNIKEETIHLITEGMRKACEPGGTGWPFFNFQIPNPNDQTKKTIIPVACKTGTAEFGHPKNKTHAWFTAFAPLASKGETLRGWEPEISVTVLVEEGGEGSSVAAPIAKKILEEWFGR